VQLPSNKKPITGEFSVTLIRRNPATGLTDTGTWEVKPLTAFSTDDQTNWFSGGFLLSSVTIPPSDLKEDDYFFYRLAYIFTNGKNPSQVNVGAGNVATNQYPNPTSNIPVGQNLLWGYYDSGSYPYIITSSDSTLVSFYDNPEIKQQDISGSGFNPVSLPWSIKYGDEFRFEGNETSTYLVSRTFGPSDISPYRLSQTGSIEVHFNANLPVNASSSIFNLDHFIIRRYVDDASQILIEGFRPTGTTGPYIITPEYVTDSLNKSADTFITDLTERGLL
jgi:hypothetical protein